MPPRGSFERRLLVALVLFSVVPSLLLIAAGSYLLSEVVALHASSVTFERIADSARDLLALADASGDPRMAAAASDHRAVLSGSLLQSGRWEYLNERVLKVIPFVALALAGVLIWLAVRAAHGIARAMARPIRELVGWSGLIARGEPLPAPAPGATARTDEFAALRSAFRAMAEEIETSRARAIEAERTRTWVTMARSVAHELKNSLTPLRFAVGALQGRLSRDAAAAEPLEVLTSEAARLDEMARAFSQFGRLPEGPPAEVDVREQLDYLVRTHLPPHVEGRVMGPDETPRVHGHHEVLSRAFANLLLNAAEAVGPEGGRVEVRIEPGPDSVVVRIRDSGPGIALERLDRIWDPDFTTKARGTGLGLALVRQAVHAHGGAVTVENPPGGGAEFAVSLPLEPRPPAEDIPETAPAWPAS